MISRNWILFKSFFAVSAVTLGGGIAMLPVIQREFTEKHDWMTDDDMADVIAVTQSSPGIIAVNLAILTGYRVGKIPGALWAAFGVSIPPFLSILVIASVFHSLSASDTLNGIFTGVRAAVCALILAAVIRLSKKMVTGTFEFCMAVLGFLGMLFDMNAILLVVLSGVSGSVRTAIREKRRTAP